MGMAGYFVHAPLQGQGMYTVYKMRHYTNTLRLYTNAQVMLIYMVQGAVGQFVVNCTIEVYVYT